MKYIIAENAGFCFGVNRAMDLAEESIKEPEDTGFSLGPLIHNPQEVERLRKLGLEKVEEMSELPDDTNTRVIIRSHGISKKILDTLEEKGYDVIDTTCPYVKSIYKKVEDFHNQGYNIVIVGNENHPEIIGINGYSDDTAFIVNSEEEALKLPAMDKVCIVCQTTNKIEIFKKVSDIIESNSTNVEMFNTICNATKIRQDSARELSKKVDAMVVIGGYSSSNTTKLAEVSREFCNNVYHIETKEELPIDELKKFDLVGVTAGASTPNWIITEVTSLINNI